MPNKNKNPSFFCASVVYGISVISMMLSFASCLASDSLSTPTPTPTQTQTPENFVASAGDTIVTLTWEESAQENTTYTLYWSLTSGTGTGGTQFPSSVVSPYTHTGLTNGTQYYYVLTASNDSGTSSPTGEVSAIPSEVISSTPANFMGASGHTTSGQAFFSSVGGKTYVYFKNFSTDSGPRLHVYLSSASNNVNDAEDLGPLTSITGDQNYEIPSGTDLSRYNKVLIWCVPFSVSFGFANLNALPN